MIKTMNSNLDERQEQALLQIEHNCCWLAFWGLLAAIFVQRAAFGADFDRTIGELVVFVVLSVYLGASCMREGVWDRRLRPDAKTNAIISCIAGLVVGVEMFLQVHGNFPDKIGGCIAAGVFAALMTGTICYVTLAVSAAVYRKRVNALEAEPDDE